MLMKESDEQSIIALFTTEKIKEYSVINTSHGDDDFREAILVLLESGEKLVVKAAGNLFTTIESINMWQRCIDEYIKLGYYCPRIFTALDGTFPAVSYKGHKCLVYAEEYSICGSVKNSSNVKPYRNSLYLMTAKIANQKFDYTDIPSAYCLFELFPGEVMDEVMENAMEFQKYCKSLPECFSAQTNRMFKRWEENREQLEDVYFKLPFSVFQADFNESNVLVDKEGYFVGIYDFNLAGKDEFLNYLFREIYKGTFEEELDEILKALSIASEAYEFSEEEKLAAPLIYRCVKPLWYTRIESLKEAGSDLAAIQLCLDEMENAQTKVIDFRCAMDKHE